MVRIVRRRTRHRARWIAVAAALLVGTAHADVDGERRAGDALALALPLGTLGVELARGDGAGAGQFVRSFAVTVAATELLQRTTGVERPDGSNDRSFPSGHAARAFAAAAYVHRRHGFDSAWPLYALATYVGATRVESRRHRWGDVAGSAALAVASAWWLAAPRAPVQPAAFGPGLGLVVQIPLR